MSKKHKQFEYKQCPACKCKFVVDVSLIKQLEERNETLSTNFHNAQQVNIKLSREIARLKLLLTPKPPTDDELKVQ